MACAGNMLFSGSRTFKQNKSGMTLPTRCTSSLPVAGGSAAPPMQLPPMANFEPSGAKHTACR